MKTKPFHLLFVLMLFFACHPKQTSKKQIEHKQAQTETKSVIPIHEDSKNKSVKAIKKKQNDEDGNVCCPIVIRSVRYDLDQEALRIISLLPKFESGAKLMGKPVKMRYIVPVNFQLEKSKQLIPTQNTNITELNLDFKLYPNPAHEFFKIEVTDSLMDKELIYNIFDLKGKLLAEGKIESTTTEINTNELNNGIYVFSLISGVLKQKNAKKIVVEK